MVESPERRASVAARSCAALHDGLDETDTILTSQPFHYVDPQWNLATALLSGATLVVLDRFRPSTFWHRFRDHRVTWSYCLGVMPKLMLNIPPSPPDREHSVKRVICSAIPRADHAAIEARWGVPWYEAFGMTESGHDVAVELADHDETVGTGCIGTPMPGLETRVVAVEDDLRGEEVMAYVVPGGGASREEVSPAVLSAFCAERLARFKVPRFWQYRDDLPRTPSERIRKEALREQQDDPTAGAWDRVHGRWR